MAGQDPHAVEGARRSALKLGGSALALSALGSPTSEARAAGVPVVTRARFQFDADFVPVVDQVNIVPWTRAAFNNGIGCTLESDGRILMNAAGLYRISLGADWVAQQGLDIDLRKIGIRRHRAAAMRSRPAFAGALDKYDDHLASCDTPGSSVPKTARWQGTWSPGTIAPGAMATLTVTLSAPNAILPGDLVMASHTQVCDAGIGAAAVDALLVQAKVVAADTVRVTMVNLLSPAAIKVPAGQLHVLAMTSVDTCGESNDAWQVLHTTTEQIQAGDRVYAVCRSLTTGDFMQCTNSSFLQIELVT